MLRKTTRFLFTCLLVFTANLFSEAALAKPKPVLPLLNTSMQILPSLAPFSISTVQTSTQDTYLELSKIVLDYFKVLAWPAVVIYIVCSFKSEFSGVLKNFSEADSLKFSVLGQPVELTKIQASASLKEIILEMKRIVKEINLEDRKQLEKIMQAKSCQYTVEDIFPDFNRTKDNTGLETLRKFRDAQFIRPESGGQWQKGKRIEIKPFGQLMWDEVGVEKLFA